MKIVDDSTQQCASKLSISSPESSVSKHVFDREKWQSLTIFEQMGNIGSEVGRAFAARRRGDTAAMTGAWQRGLDLLDATAEQLARQNRQNSAKSYAPANYSPAWKTNRWRATLCGLRWRRGRGDNKSTTPIPSPMTNQDNMSRTTLSSACNLS